MTRLLAAAAVVTMMTLAAPRAAEAQVTYQDSTGLTWGVASVEAGILLTAVTMAILNNPGDLQTIGLLLLAVTAIGGAVASGVAQGLNAPVEPAMVFHHGFTTAALLGALMTFSLGAAGVRDDSPAILGVIGLIVGAAGGATYSILRMERLAHDPELVEEAHVLSWTPLVSAGLVTALLSAVGLDTAAPIVGAITGLVALGISVAVVEYTLAETPPPEERMMMTTMPLLGYAGTF